MTTVPLITIDWDRTPVARQRTLMPAMVRVCDAVTGAPWINVTAVDLHGCADEREIYADVVRVNPNGSRFTTRCVVAPCVVGPLPDSSSSSSSSSSEERAAPLPRRGRSGIWSDVNDDLRDSAEHAHP